MSETITDVDALQARVGRLPGPRDLKVIDFLDEHAIAWIGVSPLAFLAGADDHRLAMTLAGAQAGFVRVEAVRRLSLPRAALDTPAIFRAGDAFASLFVVPGIGETLRVNGRIAQVDAETIAVDVRECYLHCAKALIRSAFWEAAPLDTDAPAAAADFASASRLMALATIDRDGRADVSPKGDPAGMLLQWRDAAWWYPDRPGNRRVDSFRNILVQPRVSAIALIPGRDCVAHVDGVASIRGDAEACAPFAVAGKTPALVTRVEPTDLRLERSAALARARLWPARPAPAAIDPVEIFKSHVKLSREGGLQAAMVRAAMSIPGLIRKGLDKDYQNNLY